MSGFNIGLGALSAARVAIDTIGHNLANASTPGYSRQRVGLSAVGGEYGTSRWISGGVKIGAIERLTDGLLVDRVRDQEQAVGRRGATLGALLEIEAAFGEPGSNGIGSRIGAFFNGLSNLSAAPDDGAARGLVVDEGRNLAARFRAAARDLGATAGTAGAQLTATADEVNAIAAEIGEINRQLASTRALDGFGHDLQDRLELLVSELAGHVDVQVTRDDVGRARVTVAGQELVSYLNTSPLEVRSGADGPRLFIEGGAAPVEVEGGRIAGLLEIVQEEGPQALVSRLDGIARELIAGFNREHAAGVPSSGGFTVLRAANSVGAGGAAGLALGLDQAGLPFDIEAGELVVNVIDDASGELRQSRVAIDPSAQTVGDFVQSLNGIEGLEARLDNQGRLVMEAEPGRRFHFGATIDASPDESFGSGSPRLATGGAEPFALTSGMQLQVQIDGGPATSVTFAAGQFGNIGQASAAEIAAAINAQVGYDLASDAGGHLVLESSGSGSSATLSVADGAFGGALAALGFPSTSATGSDQDVPITVSGEYSGEENGRISFRPVGSGEIGLTPGLQVEVLDESGTVIQTLDVGDGYAPGDPLELDSGVVVIFGAGAIDAAAGDAFEIDLLARSDTSDALVAFGLNSFFTGTGAADIDVSAELRADPSLLSTGRGSEVSDTRNVLAMLAFRERGLDGLDGKTIEASYQDVVSKVGRDVAREQAGLETDVLLLDAVRGRLEQVRGVSIDEELVDLQRFEQSYQAAARFLDAVNQMSQILLEI